MFNCLGIEDLFDCKGFTTHFLEVLRWILSLFIYVFLFSSPLRKGFKVKCVFQWFNIPVTLYFFFLSFVCRFLWLKNFWKYSFFKKIFFFFLNILLWYVFLLEYKFNKFSFYYGQLKCFFFNPSFFSCFLVCSLFQVTQ